MALARGYVKARHRLALVNFYYDIVLCFINILVLNANSVDPDQTPHSAVSDLGQHCLPITLLALYSTLHYLLFDMQHDYVCTKWIFDPRWLSWMRWVIRRLQV